MGVKTLNITRVANDESELLVANKSYASNELTRKGPPHRRSISYKSITEDNIVQNVGVIWHK